MSCDGLSLFLTFEQLKPCVLIQFVLKKKHVSSSLCVNEREREYSLVNMSRVL